MKLEGIRVLDLSQFLPGPMLTQMMIDNGAEVLKIEPPQGEPVRNVGYRSNGESVWFRNTHRGKKSLVLNLKDEGDRAAFLELARTADVVVEAFRPGVVDRLGVGYEAVKAVNPGIVYASISAFGQDGPLARTPAHDLSIEALAGVVSLNLGSDGNPTNPHMPVADMAGSFVALTGILMALLRLQESGKGDYLDISMHDALMSWLPNVTGPVFAENRAPRVKEERSFGGYALFRIYETSDARHVTLGGVEEKFAVNLLTALGRPDLIEAAISPPGKTQAPVIEFLKETFKTRTRAEWEAWFADKDVCFAPVLDLKEAFEHPHVAHREMLLHDEAGNKHIGLPIKFREEPGRADFSLPKLGEHNGAYIRRDQS